MHAPANTGTSARDALDGAITAIAAAGCETPRLDAELLLAHALEVGRERLLSDPDLLVAGPAVRAFQDAVRRRAVEREPVAYIVGSRQFRRLELAVDPRALIPRPETELLVEVGARAARRRARARRRHRQRRGGARAQGRAPRPARQRQRRQRGRAGARRVQRATPGAGRAVAARGPVDGVRRRFDAVVCNPPYVAESERALLAPEILRHEPAQALFAGPDGLSCIRELLAQIAELPDVRFLALEVGAGQAQPVVELTRAAGFDAIRFERDLARIQRVVIAERHR